MKSERWQRDRASLSRGAGARAWQARPLPGEVCGVDRALRREVEGLLAHQEQAEGFIEEPAVVIAARDLAEPRRNWFPARRWDRYRILSLLGAGGMGMVYAARRFAVGAHRGAEVPAAGICGDPEALQRFRREARALSALNHPNICTIYDIDEAEGRTFIAMEYVAGRAAGPTDRPQGPAAERGVEVRGRDRRRVGKGSRGRHRSS